MKTLFLVILLASLASNLDAALSKKEKFLREWGKEILKLRVQGIAIGMHTSRVVKILPFIIPYTNQLDRIPGFQSASIDKTVDLSQDDHIPSSDIAYLTLLYDPDARIVKMTVDFEEINKITRGHILAELEDKYGLYDQDNGGGSKAERVGTFTFRWSRHIQIVAGIGEIPKSPGRYNVDITYTHTEKYKQAKDRWSDIRFQEHRKEYERRQAQKQKNKSPGKPVKKDPVKFIKTAI